MTTNALAIIEAKTPTELFAPGFIDPLLQDLKEEVERQAALLDISTEQGRKDIAALAYKVARSKTFIDKQRLALVADEKKRLKAIDVEGGRIWDELEALQNKVRKPLTDWEDADKSRIAAHELTISETEGAALHAQQNWQVFPLDAMRDRLKEIQALDTYEWQEFQSRGRLAITSSVRIISECIEQREKLESERAELERHRAEQAERDRIEREAQIAREATEKAEAAAREASEKAERESREREEAAAKAMQEAESRAQAAEAARVESERLAAQRAAQATEQHERQQAEAVAAETRRLEQIRQREQDDEQARENNKKHAAKINREVREALMAVCDSKGNGCLISEPQATAIVTAIAQGKIPHTKITY